MTSVAFRPRQPWPARGISRARHRGARLGSQGLVLAGSPGDDGGLAARAATTSVTPELAGGRDDGGEQPRVMAWRRHPGREFRPSREPAVAPGASVASPRSHFAFLPARLPIRAPRGPRLVSSPSSRPSRHLTPFSAWVTWRAAPRPLACRPRERDIAPRGNASLGSRRWGSLGPLADRHPASACCRVVTRGSEWGLFPLDRARRARLLSSRLATRPRISA